MSEYAQRDVIALGRHYTRHVAAMTAEGLHDKSDIAAELAWRDAEAEALRADAERYRWLSKHFRVFSPHMDGQHHWCQSGEIGRIQGPTLDAAIDAAIDAARKV